LGDFGRAKRLGAALALIVAVPLQAQADRAADRRLIIAGEKAWGQSEVTRDIATIDRLVAADFRGVDASGEIYDKPTLKRWVATDPADASNTTDVASVRFYGSVALVQGHDHVIGAAPAHTVKDMIWSDVWMKRAGRWQIVAAQDTRLKPR
jgi:hypothetical protein